MELGCGYTAMRNEVAALAKQRSDEIRRCAVQPMRFNQNRAWLNDQLADNVDLGTLAIEFEHVAWR